MIVTLFADVPGSNVTVKAAEGATNITVHFDNSAWNWDSPALQFWDGSSTTPSGYQSGPTEITGWGGAQGYTLKSDGNGWYSMTLKGDFGGLQFLDMLNPSNNFTGNIYSSYMTQYNGDTPQDLYYNPDTGVWYTDSACTIKLAAPAGAKQYNTTIHYYNANWNTVYAYAWNADSKILIGGWPGTQISENTTHADWWDVQVSGLTVPKLEFKYTNAQSGGAETSNYNYTFSDENTELWVLDDQVLSTAPELWTNPNAGTSGTTYDVTFHFYNSDKWDTVAGYVWDDEGNKPCGEWTGTVMTENTEKANWYDLSVSGIKKSSVSFIFNNNDKGQQTNNLSVTLSEGTTEVWVTGGDRSSADPGTVYTQAPELWTNPGSVTENTAHSIYYAKDSMAVKIGSTTYPMSVYANGVFKCTVDLAVGNYTATVIKNGVESSVTASVNVTDASKKTEISLDNDVLTSASVVESTDTDSLTVSFIGDAREDGDNNWSPAVKGYEFTKISDTLYRYEKTFANAGTYSYKAVFNYSTWYEKEGSGNRMLNLTKDNTHVVFCMIRHLVICMILRIMKQE